MSSDQDAVTRAEVLVTDVAPSADSHLLVHNDGFVMHSPVNLRIHGELYSHTSTLGCACNLLLTVEFFKFTGHFTAPV
jgi:hypothetical protein